MRALSAWPVLLVLVLGACGAAGPGGSDQKKGRVGGAGTAADTSTCVERARAFTGTFPANYPRDFPLPRGAVLVDVEDRGRDGAIGTAVVKATLKQVLDQLNGPAVDAGFTVTGGETERRDAEANWTGNGYRGRWAIRESATCAGQVVIEVLARRQ